MSVRYARHNPWRTFESSILEAEDLPIYEKMAYIVISSHATATDQRSWPSYETIARKGSMSVRKAKLAVKALIEKGLIVRIHRYKQKPNSKGEVKVTNDTNLFIIFPHSEPFDAEKEVVDNNGVVHDLKEFDEPGAQDAPPIDTPCTGCTPPMHDMHPPGAQDAHRTRPFNKTKEKKDIYTDNARAESEFRFYNWLKKSDTEVPS